MEGKYLSPVDELCGKEETAEEEEDAGTDSKETERAAAKFVVFMCQKHGEDVSKPKKIGNDIAGVTDIALVSNCVIVLASGTMTPFASQPSGYFYGHYPPKETPQKRKLNSGLEIDGYIHRLESNGKDYLLALSADTAYAFKYQGGLKFESAGSCSITFSDLALGRTKAVLLEKKEKKDPLEARAVLLESLDSEGQAYKLPLNRVWAQLAPSDNVALVAFDGKKQGKAYTVKHGEKQPKLSPVSVRMGSSCAVFSFRS